MWLRIAFSAASRSDRAHPLPAPTVTQPSPTARPVNAASRRATLRQGGEEGVLGGSTFLLDACRQSVCYILNHMVQYTKARLDASFAALSDATRRGVLDSSGVQTLRSRT
jgi:hypothetical protein